MKERKSNNHNSGSHHHENKIGCFSLKRNYSNGSKHKTHRIQNIKIEIIGKDRGINMVLRLTKQCINNTPYLIL